MTTPNPPQPGPQQPYGAPGAPGPGPQGPGPQGPPQGYPQQGYPGGAPQGPGPQGPGPQGYGQQGPQYQQPPQYPAEPPKKKSPVRRIVLSLVALGVIVVIALVGKQITGDPDTAAVGECMSGTSADNLKVVSCTDAGAQYKIVGKVEGKSQTEFNINSESICKPYAQAESAFWKGEQGGSGYVLCLGANK